MSVRRADPATSRVVLIGVPTYGDPALADVPAIANNVSDLAEILTDPDLGQLEVAHRLVAPPTADAKQIGELLGRAAAEAEDLLLLYYSGHGLLGRRRRELYLSLHDTRSDLLPFTAMAYDAVREVLLDSRAANKVVILDSCFSGRGIGDTLADDTVLGQLEVAGTYTLTSAPANRTALVFPGEQHTAFTGRLLHLLRTGSPTAGPLLSLGEIYRHLHAQLLSEGLPIPQQCGTATADLLGLVRNRRFADASTVVRRATGRRSDRLPLPDADHTTVKTRMADPVRDHADRLWREAERIAGSISGKTQRTDALGAVAGALAATDPDRAEQIAESITSSDQTDPHHKDQVLGAVAEALAATDPDRAEKVAEKILEETPKLYALGAVAEALAATDPDRAEFLLEFSGLPFYDEIAKLAKALAATDPDRAERIAIHTFHPDNKAKALAQVARVLADTDPDRAARLWSDADSATLELTNENLLFWTLIEIAATQAIADPDRAEQTANKITDPRKRVDALIGIAVAQAAADPDRAEQTVTMIHDADWKAKARAGIAVALAATDPDRAEQLAGSITGATRKAEALAGIAVALAATDPDRAEQLAGSITDAYWMVRALAGIAKRLMSPPHEATAEAVGSIGSHD